MSKSGIRPLQTPVLQYKLNGSFIREWSSIKEVEEFYGKGLNISNCCSGYKKSAAGFIWIYKVEGENILANIKSINLRKNSKPVLQYKLDGTFIKEWGNSRVASEVLGIHKNSIRLCSRGERNHCGNFIWRYKTGEDIPIKILPTTRKILTKKVVQYDLYGNSIKEWLSIKSASETLDIDGGIIGQCASGKLISAGGYLWTGSTDTNPPLKINKIDKVVGVLQYDLNGNFIKEWPSSKDVVKGLGVHAGHLSECLSNQLRSTAGFIWALKESEVYSLKIKGVENKGTITYYSNLFASLKD
jgi:hypothetical protein